MRATKSVKIVLINKGLTIADLARMTGFSREHLSGVINGRYQSERARKIIALALGKGYRELWGPEQQEERGTGE